MASSPQAQPIAQPTAQTTSLKQALEAAWQMSSAARAESNRRLEFAAKGKAVSGWLSGEPVASVAHQTDLLTKNEGFRGYEAEIELPLWNPGVRSANQADIAAQQQSMDMQIAFAKLKLAGELRALAANTALALVELDLQQRKLHDAKALKSDIDRRVKAGENARVDGLQADLIVKQAQTASAQADGQLLRLQNQWRSLTGFPSAALLDERLANTLSQGTAPVSVSPDHPAQRLALAQVRSAQTKLSLADTDNRDPLAIALGISRERGSFANANETKLRLALKIPLGGDNRNAPRKAAARAELDTAQAEADATLRHLSAEVTVAAAELNTARAALADASERVRLSNEIKALITKSWRLGDSDLPARLRADNEQFEANLSLARATVDVQRAVANLNQAHGYLP